MFTLIELQRRWCAFTCQRLNCTVQSAHHMPQLHQTCQPARTAYAPLTCHIDTAICVESWPVGILLQASSMCCFGAFLGLCFCSCYITPNPLVDASHIADQCKKQQTSGRPPLQERASRQHGFRQAQGSRPCALIFHALLMLLWCGPSTVLERRRISRRNCD